MDKKEIKTIEDISLNAWPSHQMQIYDGWILRFSYYYTHRTNCVEQIGISQIPAEQKIDSKRFTIEIVPVKRVTDAFRLLIKGN